jgi:hypothetical protein
VLKPTLSREEFMTFTAGEEINCADLKRKHRLTSDEHLSGRNLLDMARRGMKDFRKAMAFAKDKWDVKKIDHLNWVQWLMIVLNTFSVGCIFSLILVCWMIRLIVTKWMKEVIRR